MESRYGYSTIEKRFKSKGETEIGRFLERERIDYFYEHPIAVLDCGKTKIWYPDFLLPEYAMVIEYFGIKGDDYYNHQAQHKKEVYAANGIETLLLTDVSFKGEWPSRILGQIEANLRDRLDRFYRR